MGVVYGFVSVSGRTASTEYPVHSLPPGVGLAATLDLEPKYEATGETQFIGKDRRHAGKYLRGVVDPVLLGEKARKRGRPYSSAEKVETGKLRRVATQRQLQFDREPNGLGRCPAYVLLGRQAAQVSRICFGAARAEPL